MSTSLIDGLAIVLVISVMAILLMPILLLVLPDRINNSEEEAAA